MLTTRFVTGAPNWIDLGTPDIEGATAFYRALFGWDFRSAGPEAGGYGFFQLGGRTAGGGMQMTEEQGVRRPGRCPSRPRTSTPPSRPPSRPGRRADAGHGRDGRGPDGRPHR